MNFRYNTSPYFYNRRKTREVKVGEIGIGGNNPIRIQSMTTSDTMDTDSTVKQILALSEVGCEIVRVTVPSMPDAENLKNIREKLAIENCRTPIVADIHFTPSVAMKVVEYVEKVRINPGNFADKKKFSVHEYSDKEYEEEIFRISEIFTPLVLRCKELGVSMRIGTNHGSLSDRIMNRYGDTPMGMVESAIEFIRIAEANSFQDIVVSMKSSNPQVMVQAYRLLTARFTELEMDYPLHLGVTEAGDGKDGRIKSSIGIGALLEDGIGDTIRVSLTEDSVHEIPVARKIADKYNRNQLNPANIREEILIHNSVQKPDHLYKEFRNPFSYSRFFSDSLPVGDLRLGENLLIRVELNVPHESKNGSEIISDLKTLISRNPDLPQPEIFSFEIRENADLKKLLDVREKIETKFPFSLIINRGFEIFQPDTQKIIAKFQKIVLNPSDYISDRKPFADFLKFYTGKLKSVEFRISESDLIIIPELVDFLNSESITNILFSFQGEEILHGYRKLAFQLKDRAFPILLEYTSRDIETCLYDASISLGGLLIDGIGDAIRLSVPAANPEELLSLSFDILQATRLRISRTEFISCPSCGRTLFNLQETTARIKMKTGHLKGIKIAIMGCIVNGPGEMADADFGYVGAGPGKVHLYKGKEIMAKSVPSEIADDRLVELIKQNGMWVES